MLHFYDRHEPKTVTRSNLPHWWQPGRVTFITFRLADSTPVGLVRHWNLRRRAWLLAEGGFPRDWSTDAMVSALREPLRSEYHRRFTAEFEAHLDRGLGDCLLRDPENAAIVGDAFRHFDGLRYELVRFVVMPNHAHVLVGLLGDWSPTALCESWKSYTARQINRRMRRAGRVWQPESFDHLVRSPERCEGSIRYIDVNPEKAGLEDGEYLLGGGSGFRSETS